MVVVVVVVRTFAVRSIHIVFHVFYHGIELGFLFIRQDFTHFCVEGADTDSFPVAPR